MRTIADARTGLAQAALAAGEGDDERGHLRPVFAMQHAAAAAGRTAPFERLRALGLAVVKAQRQALDTLRGTHRIGADGYLAFQEELDWKEPTRLPEDDRRREEG